MVLVNFNFQCRSANINSGGNLIGNLETDIIPAYSIQVDVTEDKALTIDASGKITALWGLDANKYYADLQCILRRTNFRGIDNENNL